MNWVDLETEHALHASVVLDDAMSAILKWSWGPIEKGVESRVIYVASVTLLRTVGHVLHKVDCDRHPEIKQEVERKYRDWKRGLGKDRIFTDFIEKERNLILKEYAPSWRRENEVDLTWRVRAAQDNQSEMSSKLQAAMAKSLEQRPLKAVFMETGPYAGYDFGELLEKAARWWGCQLTEITSMVEQK